MGMLRITTQKLLILFRLVIFVSLAVYALPSSSAAMHSGWSKSEIAQSSDHHDTASGVHSHGDQDSSAEGDQKPAKQQCCKDFCAGMAILAATDAIGGPRVSPVREFVDDARTTGEMPLLHRPPSA
ncbi:hypothetical protein [Sinorhizobium meliloti]|uniref:Uncharacterized protein n=1 Tax=Sinorhizobium meliloti (strain SM11) TaxID=707241 RepID=F7X793_SINMM|nr:hypothetical protein [Sinorhizobium meliloti]PST29635.1 hypothetical protein C7U62_03360 [Mesorhizobium loti]AEH77494.1 hypothetical protein SM11_chr0209 [Sinorhizobium meliloti SM11]ARS69777.1 hypothetical protein SMRU11_22020 [Sinorhizobium meliloti RU11/001]ASP64638.1 hypothetical protein CDO29_08585 [Sinorhizobium meliloti]MBP2464660.1 hypothetical protein [Sinorhizobium meliloti]